MQPDLLRAVPFLRDLTTDELDAFAALLEPREIAKGQNILVEGEPVDALYIVTQGSVHIRRHALKREVLLGRVGVGGFFGEINLFDSGVATASVMAVGRVQLAVVSHEALKAFMNANPGAGYKITSSLLGEVSRRLRLTNQRLVNAVYWATAPDPAKAATSL